MIRLKKTHNIVFTILIILVGLVLHVTVIPNPPVEKAWSFSPSHKLGEEAVLEQPPALLLDGKDRLHLLGYSVDDKLQYQILTTRGEELSSVILNVPKGKVRYLVPVQKYSAEVEFIIVIEEGSFYTPYFLTLSEGEGIFTELPFKPPTSKDISVTKVDQDYYFVYVEDTDQFTMYLQRYDGANWFERVKVSESKYLGLPRIGADVLGRLHLAWKGQYENLIKEYYNRFDPLLSTFALNEAKVVGDAAQVFGDVSKKPFKEDIGARMLPTADGGMYLTWTYAFLDETFNQTHSSFYLLNFSKDGELVEQKQFKGKNDFALFADFVLDEQGVLTFFYEDFYDRTFNIMEAKYTGQDTLEGKRTTISFGNHRLVQALNDSSGNTLVVWKHLAGKQDEILLRNSLELTSAKWFDRWAMWFAHEDFTAIVRDGFFSLIYSLIGAIAFVGSNALLLLIFAVVLYLMQSRQILGKLNFLLVMSVASVVLLLTKFYGGFLYSTPNLEDGFMLFSALFSTVIVLSISWRHWKKGAEEIMYLNHLMLWIFTDALISFMYVAPGMLAP